MGAKRATSGAVCPVCERNVGARKPIMIGPPPHRELSRGDKVTIHDYPKNHENAGKQCPGSNTVVQERWSVANGQRAT